MKSTTNTAGFTLIELMLVTAFTLVMTLAFCQAYAMLKTQALQITTIATEQEDARIAITTLTNALHQPNILITTTQKNHFDAITITHPADKNHNKLNTQFFVKPTHEKNPTTKPSLTLFQKTNTTPAVALIDHLTNFTIKYALKSKQESQTKTPIHQKPKILSVEYTLTFPGTPTPHQWKNYVALKK